MKVALVHDYLNQYGGGERVLEVLMEMFPEAPIYTILHDKEATLNRFASRVKQTSGLDFSWARKHHRWVIPLMPSAIGKLKIPDEYDLILSDTAGFAKGIQHGPKAVHISYIHTPLRYAWETGQYFQNAVFKTVFRPVFEYLRRWDFKAAQKPDFHLANSKYIAEKIKNYYGCEAKVVYPPVDLNRFYYDNAYDSYKRSYYLAVGRLLHYKRFDLIVSAFGRLGYLLKIVGDGPELNRLKARTKKMRAFNIEFIPFLKDENDLRKLYNGARALIFPQVEDFGLVAAEAQACGAPVIAYAGGGVLEVVQSGETGIFFEKQEPKSLIEAVQKFEKTQFSREKIADLAKRFSKERFKKEVGSFVKSAYEFIHKSAIDL